MTPLLGASVAVALVGLGLWLVARRRAAAQPSPPKTAPPLATLGLLLVLGGFFVAFCALAPEAARTPWTGLAVFVATAALFRLMARFESPG